MPTDARPPVYAYNMPERLPNRRTQETMDSFDTRPQYAAPPAEARSTWFPDTPNGRRLRDEPALWYFLCALVAISGPFAPMVAIPIWVWMHRKS